MGVLWIILGGTLVVFALAGIWLGGWFFGLALLTKILLTVLVLIILAFVLVTMRIVKMMRACPQPIVAAVDGICAGAGAIVAMASDLRLGTPRAKVEFLFNKVGLAGCDMGA